MVSCWYIAGVALHRGEGFQPQGFDARELGVGGKRRGEVDIVRCHWRKVIEMEEIVVRGRASGEFFHVHGDIDWQCWRMGK